MMALKFLFKMLTIDKYFIIYAICYFMGSLLGVYTSVLLGGVVDSVTAENAKYAIFIRALLIYIGVTFSINFLKFISEYTSKQIFPKIGKKSSEYFYNRIVQNSVNFVLENNSGYISSYIGRFYGDMAMFLANVYQGIFVSFSLFIISVITIFSYVPEVAFAIFVLAIMYSLLYIGRIKSIREAYTLHYKNHAKFSGTVVDIISNILLVKSFNRLKSEDTSFEDSLETLEKSDQGCLRADSIATLFHYFLNGIFMMLTVSYSAYLVFDKQIEISVFVILNGLALKCGRELNSLMRAFKMYKKLTGNISKALELINREIEIKDSPNAKELKLKEASISIKNVDFKYKDGTGYVFRCFNLEIPAGQKVGLVGHSGGGKSSLVQILQRFYDIDAGEIKFDGQEIRDVTQESLRENISYIPQEPSLFSRSVYENIAYAKIGATKEEVYEAAKLANAHEFIEKLPQKYDTQVGERGFKLSGGQKQRVAIARAILKNSPIILMDEATSALDSHSEKLIQESLEKLMQDKTCIVIAHRLSTIKNMDRVVVLEDGNIIQDGKHSSLVRKEGIYKKLWNLQYSGLIQEN